MCIRHLATARAAVVSVQATRRRCKCADVSAKTALGGSKQAPSFLPILTLVPVPGRLLGACGLRDPDVDEPELTDDEDLVEEEATS